MFDNRSKFIYIVIEPHIEWHTYTENLNVICAIMNSNQKIIKFKFFFLRDIWKIASKWIYEKMKNELYSEMGNTKRLLNLKWDQNQHFGMEDWFHIIIVLFRISVLFVYFCLFVCLSVITDVPQRLTIISFVTKFKWHDIWR